MYRSVSWLALSCGALVACGEKPKPAPPVTPRPTDTAKAAKTSSPTKPTEAPPSKASGNFGTPAAALAPTPTKCDALGYCLVTTPSRLTTGSESITGIWGSAPDNVYFTGERGLLLRFDGKTIGGVRVDGQEEWPLTDVWSAGPNELYVVGGKGLFRFDGKEWAKLTSDAMGGRILGRSPGNLWIAHGPSVVRVAGGKTTTERAGASTFDIWESGPNDAYAAGEFVLLHYDGTKWSSVENLGTEMGTSKIKENVLLRAVWGSGPSDVFACGTNVCLHFDGKAWAKQPLPKGTGDVVSVRGTGPNDVYAISKNGSLVHYDGVSWLALTDVSLGTPWETGRMWFSTPDDVWFGGKAAPLVRLERTFAKEPSGTDKDLFSVAGAAGEAFAVGDAGTAIHSIKGAWKAEPTGTKKALRDVWMASANDAWAAGDGGTVLQWNGKTWKTHVVPTKNDLSAIAGGPAGTAVAVGKAGTVIVFDGKKWALVPSKTTVDLLSVAVGAGGIDAFVAGGDAGTVVRAIAGASQPRDAAADTIPDAGPVRGAWFLPGAAAGAAVPGVVDARGGAYRYVGGRWEKQVSAAGLDIRGTALLGTTVWAAGGRGTIHVRTDRNERPWLTDLAPANMDVADVWGEGEKDVIAVGKGGVVARRKRR